MIKCITPFIAWPEALQERKVAADVTLYYYVNHENECLEPEYLKALVAESDVALCIYCVNKDGFLNPEILPLGQETKVFFCGPVKFSAAVEKVMRRKGLSVPKHLHREYFDIR